MRKSHRDKIIVGLITLSLTFAPVFSVLIKTQKIEAATFDSSNSGDYSFSISNITDSGLLSAVIGCTGITDRLTTAVNDIFSPKDNASAWSYGDSGGSGVPAGPTSLSNPEGPSPDEGGSDVTYGDGNGDTSYGGYDTESISGNDVPTSEKNSAAIAADEAKQKEIAVANKKREECFNGIAYYLAKKQLADMTEKTVNWINSGYNGEALFVKNQDSFYGSIRNQTLTELLNPFTNDPLAFPYGKDFARGQIINARNLSQDILKSRLQPEETANFNQSFSNGGGWSQWLNVTQNPGNNPLGFASMASDYITSTINNKILATDKELMQGDGFLSQKKCVKYEESPDATVDKTKNCIQYEIVTPGSMIASKLSFTLNSPERQLEAANDINSSMNKIFSALIDSLMNWGLSSLDKNSYQPSTDLPALGGFGSNTVYDVNGNSVSGTYYDSTGAIISVNKGSGWSNANGKNFDITTDLGDYCIGTDLQKGVISIQNDYIKAIKGDLSKSDPYSFNKNKKDEGSLGNLKYIMPALGELDYCIPGPNPGWKQSTQMTLNAVTSYMQDMYLNDKGKPVIPNINDYKNEFIDSSKPWIQLNIPNISADLSTAFKTNGLEDFHNKNSWLFSLDAIGLSGTLEGIFCGLFDCGKSNAQLQAEAQAKADAALAKAQSDFDFSIKTIVTNLKIKFENYSKLIEENYGYSSPMLKQDYYGYSINSAGNYTMRTNKEYLPMGITGLELTKNIGVYALNIDTSTKEYNSLVSQTISNVYQLNIIKDKIKILMDKVKANPENVKARNELPVVCRTPQYVINSKGVCVGTTYIGNGTDTGVVSATCNDGKKNGDETGIDCGGSCSIVCNASGGGGAY